MSKALPIKNFPNYYITENGDVYSRNERWNGKIKNAGGFQWQYK